jgi:hypothetical protein
MRDIAVHGQTYTYKLLRPLSYEYFIVNNFETGKYVYEVIHLGIHIKSYFNLHDIVIIQGVS